MVKNTLKKNYLTDEYEEDVNINLNYKKNKSEDKKKLGKKLGKSKLNNFMDDLFHDENDSPKIEFIVEEDENKEKQIRMNFEFMVGVSNELIKIDLEISKSTYLEIANELLK